MPAAFTTTWFDSLPAMFRSYDVDGDMVGFLDGLGIEAQVIDALITRIDKVFPDEGGAPGDTSDLVDPATADASWLQWVAMVYGVVVDPNLTTAEKRIIIAARPAWLAGSAGAIGDAVAAFLTGTATVTFNRSFGGNWATVEVVTYTAETPDAAAVADYLSARDTAPAHVLLVARVAAGASYAQLDTEFGTYADMKAGLTTYEAQRTHIP